MITDLKNEKHLVELELQKLLDNQFGTQRESELQRQLLDQKAKMTELERQLMSLLEDKAALNDTIQELTVQVTMLTEGKSQSDAALFNAKHEIEELKDKLKYFSNNGEVDLSEIEEALTMVRLKRERGLTLDFLIHLDAAAEDKRALNELRVQFAECAQELEKYTRLLQIQERINKDYKKEVDQLRKQLTSLQNEYGKWVYSVSFVTKVLKTHKSMYR